VDGNHDPYNTMRKLVAPYPNISLYKRLEIEEGGRRYFITHGHQWAIDWGFLGLDFIAPWFVEKMVDVAPGWWYKFCRWKGWLASQPTPGASAGEEKERITRLTRVIWAGASSLALKNDCCVVIGHTHTTGRHERGVSKERGFEAYMLDEGNLPDGTYGEITSDAQLQFL
jgi:hypothetical protein